MSCPEDRLNALRLSVNGRSSPAAAEPGGPAWAPAPTDWSPDGRWIALTTWRGSLIGRSSTPAANRQVWIYAPAERSLTRFAESNANTWGARFSPDGRLIAYISDRTGEPEIYVAPFPVPGRPVRVSLAGGRDPRWRSDGRELFYLEPVNRGRGTDLSGASSMAFMSVSIEETSPVRIAPPRRLFSERIWLPAGDWPWVLAMRDASTRYDVTPDGKRFLIHDPAGRRAPVLTIVEHWQRMLDGR